MYIYIHFNKNQFIVYLMPVCYQFLAAEETLQLKGESMAATASELWNRQTMAAEERRQRRGNSEELRIIHWNRKRLAREERQQRASQRQERLLEQRSQRRMASELANCF